MGRAESAAAAPATDVAGLYHQLGDMTRTNLQLQEQRQRNRELELERERSLRMRRERDAIQDALDATHRRNQLLAQSLDEQERRLRALGPAQTRAPSLIYTDFPPIQSMQSTSVETESTASSGKGKKREMSVERSSR